MESSFISAEKPVGDPYALTLKGLIISGSTIKSNCIPETALFGLLIITGTSISEEYPGYSTSPNVTEIWADKIPRDTKITNIIFLLIILSNL